MRKHWLALLLFCAGSAHAQFVKNTGIVIVNSTNVTVNSDWDNTNGSFTNNGTITTNDNWTSTGGYSQSGTGGFVLTNTATKQFNHAGQYVGTLTKNGAGNTQINNHLIVKSNLTLTNGLLSMTGANDTIVTLANAVVTGTPSSYVVGKVSRYGNGDLFFPIAIAGNYMPITIYQVAGTNPRVTVTLQSAGGGYSINGAGNSLIAFPYVWKSAVVRGDTASYVEVQYPTTLPTSANPVIVQSVNPTHYNSMGLQSVTTASGVTKIKSYARGLKGLFSVAQGVLLALDAPVATTATTISPVGFTANWSAVVNATGYQLDVSADNFATYVSGFSNLSIPGTSAAVTGLNPSTAYKYRVRATGTAPTSISSNVVSANTLLSPPVAAAATSITQTGFTANWATTTGATGYQLDVSADNFATFVAGFNNLALTGTSSTVTGLTAGTPYKFRVRATSAAPTSANSNVIDVSTLAIPAPVATAATLITITGFTANWAAVTGATGYQLDVSADNFATLVTGFNNLAVTGTTNAVTGLTGGTVYKYRVRAAIGTPVSVNSNVIDVTTLPALTAAPVAAAATSVTQIGFTANWAAVTGATGYQLDVSADNFATFVTGFNSLAVTGTSSPVTGLIAGTAYKYRARATSTLPVSVNSNVIDVSTLAKVAQTITFVAIADKTLGDPAFQLGATASSGLTVGFSTTSDKVTISGAQVTLVKAGRATITATQAGNATFNAATSIDQSFCIKPAKPSVTISNNNSETPVLTSSAAAGNQWYLNGAAIPGATNPTFSVTSAGVYKVQARADDCLSDFSADVPIIVTGDMNKESVHVNAYPNPVEDHLEIRGLKGEVSGSQLFDMTGRLNSIVLERKDEVYRAGVQHLSPGVYLLRLQEGATIHQIKFIKN